ncbi:CHAD domain-containing protein [Brevundimonas pondensis]|uniref:CHAD domain-containing protein n=1 Tax=Brevundimonas pondensis TaxID=2774189 RepID=A0ABX7SPF0_9CAUL|nr:CHAD domain-containing protein [Brevundimonas pondensis]
MPSPPSRPRPWTGCTIRSNNAPDLFDLDAEARHHLRIRTKRLRYAAEFFTDLFPARRRRARYLKALERLQDTLGALNDLAVARDRIPAKPLWTTPRSPSSPGASSVGMSVTRPRC